MPKHPPSPKTRWAGILLLFLIVAGIGFTTNYQLRSALRKAQLSEVISNARSFKLAFDSFAMDNDGLYPSVDTAEFYEVPNPRTSNEFFRQIFASANTNSERIYWVKRSSVCNPNPPDDTTTIGGKFDPAQTLQAGDNHWAYVTDLTNVSNPDTPIVLDPYLPGTTTFDRKLWGGKALVVRVDSSASPRPLTRTGTLLDDDGKNLLSPESKVWNKLPPDLRQPDPRK